ncbi:hsc70cb [Babesia gibsoni]|uniref:Hsc70cb n=1 Tax=Babesia gibsoni TaxID=33632 RepID=A0AAD8LQN0_BABGI|nr:hsc70cb [Babesia gibsoni]
MDGKRVHSSPVLRLVMRQLIALLLALHCFLSLAEASTVTIGVDWGDEFVEVAIAFRGHKPDILLNDTGSRKFVNAVYLDGKTRFFDKKAVANVVKTPAKTVRNYAHMLGLTLHPAEDGQIRVVPKEEVFDALKSIEYAYDWDYAPYEFGADSDGLMYLNITKDRVVKAEEVAGHFFSYIKDIVKSKLTSAKVMKPGEGSPKVVAVISIPCNYTQRQRKAIAFAAETAGISVAQIVHGITAASAVRAFEHGPGIKKLLFYDLGSSGANVGVIEVLIPDPKNKDPKAVKETQIHVLSCIHEHGIGGRHHDVALAEHLRGIFEHKTGVKLMPDHPQALQKLLQAANKAKVALTISESTAVAIEGLTRNINFDREVVTRETFNLAIKESIDRLHKPLQLALERAGNLKLEDLDGVELIGGAWRVPVVHSKLEELMKPHTLGFHLNAEEAVAMGSGYLAAARNPFFKMKSATIVDNSVHSYAISISSIELDHADAIFKETHLFKPESKFQGVKAIVFKTKLDFSVKLTENALVIAEYEVRGITDEMKKEEHANKLAKVTLVFKPNDKGIIPMPKVTAMVEPEATEEKAAEDKAKEAEDTGDEGTKTEEKETKEGGEEEAGTEKEKEKPLPLELNVSIASEDPFSKEKLEVSQNVIEELRKRDVEITMCAEKKNLLESLIYKYKSASKQQPFQAACDTKTYSSLKDLLKSYEEWFDEESFDAGLKEFEDRIQKLEEMAHPIHKRWMDNEARPTLVLSTNKQMQKLQSKIDELLQQKPYLSEKENILDDWKEIKTWWETVQKEQESLQPHQEPAFTADLVKFKLDLAHEVIATLERVKPPKEVKKDDGSEGKEEAQEDPEVADELPVTEDDIPEEETQQDDAPVEPEGEAEATHDEL